MSILVLPSLARKRELVSVLLLSFGCLVTVNVLWLFLTVLWICLQSVIVVYPDHAHFFIGNRERSGSVVECLTQDQGVAGSSLTGVTVLWSLSKTHLSLLSSGSTQEDPFLFN